MFLMKTTVRYCGKRTFNIYCLALQSNVLRIQLYDLSQPICRRDGPRGFSYDFRTRARKRAWRKACSDRRAHWKDHNVRRIVAVGPKRGIRSCQARVSEG